MQLDKVLPPIPAKRYFTIGEVGELCGVKPHVLRYWEQEFTQLKPMKRRGNRRYYQHHEVLMIRRIRDLLYERDRRRLGQSLIEGVELALHDGASAPLADDSFDAVEASFAAMSFEGIELMRRELFEIRNLLSAEPQLAY
jgi:hypothetical protein